jgi:hypothetical protein
MVRPTAELSRNVKPLDDWRNTPPLERARTFKPIGVVLHEHAEVRVWER